MRRVRMLVLSLTLVAAWLGCDSPADIHRFSFETMGTIASGTIEVWDKTMPVPPEQIVAATFDSVNVQLSSWSTTSEIGRLNAAPADSLMRVTEWVSDCLLASESLHRASDGAFDVTAEPLMRLWGFYRRQGHLPSEAEMDSVLALLGGYTFDASERTVIKQSADTRFDLGGIAKGFAVDRATANLIEAGISAALIDLGGNIFCLGIPEDGTPWRVGVRDPLDRDSVMATLSVTHRALATSGSYERFVEIDGRTYGHIMNPATGHPAEGLLSVTIIGGSATLCDGLSTTLYVLGLEGALDLLQSIYTRYDAVLVAPPAEGDPRIRVLATAGLRDNLSLREGYAERYRLEFLPF